MLSGNAAMISRWKLWAHSGGAGRMSSGSMRCVVNYMVFW